VCSRTGRIRGSGPYGQRFVGVLFEHVDAMGKAFLWLAMYVGRDNDSVISFAKCTFGMYTALKAFCTSLYRFSSVVHTCRHTAYFFEQCLSSAR
jgi:hypothetical protein